MKIKMKYSIGDKFTDKYSGAVNTINAWKVEISATGVAISYAFKSPEDGIFAYDLYLLEPDMIKKDICYSDRQLDWVDYQLSCETPHPVEIEVSDTDVNGEPIKIGDEIYVGVLHGRPNELTPEARMTFASWNRVNKLVFQQRMELIHIQPNKYGPGPIEATVVSERLGPCTDSRGLEYKDARRFGNINNHHLSYVCKALPAWFIGKYVDVLKNHREMKNQILNNDEWAHDCIQILKHMGIFDQVIKAIQSPTPKKKPNTKKKATKKQKPAKIIDWEAIAKTLAEKNGIDITEFIKK